MSRDCRHVRVVPLDCSYIEVLVEQWKAPHEFMFKVHWDKRNQQTGFLVAVTDLTSGECLDLWTYLRTALPDVRFLVEIEQP